jgi:hypothetical protein
VGQVWTTDNRHPLGHASHAFDGLAGSPRVCSMRGCIYPADRHPGYSRQSLLTLLAESATALVASAASYGPSHVCVSREAFEQVRDRLSDLGDAQ